MSFPSLSALSFLTPQAILSLFVTEMQSYTGLSAYFYGGLVRGTTSAYQ